MGMRGVMCAVLMLVGIVWYGGARATDLRNVGGMYACFSQENDNRYKELSVLEGAAAWHRGVIRNLYDYAMGIDEAPPVLPIRPQQGDGQNSTKKFRDSLNTYERDMKEWMKKIPSPVVRLVRKLFVYPAGSRVAGDFTLSTRIKGKYSNVEFAKKIAHIVTRIWWIKYHFVEHQDFDLVLKSWLSMRVKDLSNAQYLSELMHVDEWLVLGVGNYDPLFGNVFSVLDGFRMVYLAALWKHCGVDRAALVEYVKTVDIELSLLEQLDTFIAGDVRNEGQLSQSKERLDQCKKDLENLKIALIVEHDSVARDVQMMLDAKKDEIKNETDREKKKQLTAAKQKLFNQLRSMIEKYDFSQLGEDFVRYNNLLQDVIHLDIEYNALLNAKKTSRQISFFKEEKYHFVAQLASEFDSHDVPAIIDEVRAYQGGSELRDEQIEKLVFVALQPGKYPPVASLRSDVMFSGEKFTDCVEHMLRSFINFIVYDKHAKKFDVDRLITITGNEPAADLRDFYERYNDINTIGHVDVHNAWVELISNRPFLSYMKHVGFSGDPASSEWFVRIPSVFQLTGRMRPFIFVKQDDLELYELRATMRNIIILFNDIFNLSLFKDNQELFTKFTKGVFVREYLERAFAPFGTIEVVTLDGNKPIPFALLDDIDRREVSYFEDISNFNYRINIIITLSKLKEVFNEIDEPDKITMTLYLGYHGEVATPVNVPMTLDFFSTYLFNDYYPSFLSMLPSSEQGLALYNKHIEHKPFHNLMCLLTRSLNNYDDVLLAMRNIQVLQSFAHNHYFEMAFKINNPTIDEMRKYFEDYVQNNSIEWMQDFTRKLGLLELESKVISSSWVSLDFLDWSFENVKNILLTNGQRGLAYYQYEVALQLCKAFLRQDRTFNYVRVFIRNLMETGQKKLGLNLLTEMVTLGEGFDEAIAYAQESGEKSYQLDRLYEELIKRGRAVLEVFNYLSSNRFSFFGDICDSSLYKELRMRLLSLIEQERELEMVTEIAKKMISSGHRFSSLGWELCNLLADRMLKHDFLFSVVEDTIKNDWPYTVEYSMKLLWKLVRNSFEPAIEEAFEVAKNLQVRKEYRFLEDGKFNLWRILVQKGRYFDDALLVAQEKVLSERISDGFLLFQDLVEKNVGIKEAVSALESTMMKKYGRDVKIARFALYKVLLQKSFYKNYDKVLNDIAYVMMPQKTRSFVIDWSDQISGEIYAILKFIIIEGKKYNLSLVQDIIIVMIQASCRVTSFFGFDLTDLIFKQKKGARIIRIMREKKIPEYLQQSWDSLIQSDGSIQESEGYWSKWFD